MAEDTPDVAVIGAGIVGLASAIRLVERGFSVTIIDPFDARARASYGNSGVIGRGSILPMAGPGVWKYLGAYAFGRSAAVRFDLSHLIEIRSWLGAFLARCNEPAVRAAAAALAPLTKAARQAHLELADLVGGADLVRDTGWIKAYRSARSFAGGALERRLLSEHGIAFEILESDALADLEPALTRRFERAMWLTETATVARPGDLVARIEAHARERASAIEGRVTALTPTIDGIRLVVEGLDRTRRAIVPKRVVLAAGHGGAKLAGLLGVTIPFAAERGYHVNVPTPVPLGRPIYDVEGHHVLCPDGDHVRITTGVELARPHAHPNLSQMTHCLAEARGTLALGEPIEPQPWIGSRPSTPDGLPVIGWHPRDPRIVFAFGHNHIGFSTGPITGEIVAALMTGAAPPVPIGPFAPGRFGPLA